jgi:type VI secretion system secreted protein Hcp
MAVSIFGKFPSGIKGESKQAGHEEEVVILSLSWGLSRPAALTGNSRQTGVASFSDVTIMKETDAASNDLFVGCAKATAMDEIVITFVKDAGDDQVDYLTYTLSNCLISSYQVSGSSGGGTPTESISISFTKIKALYKAQDVDHSAPSDHEGEYDLMARV